MPEDIQSMVIESLKQGEQLTPFSFEIYYDDGSLSVEYWLKPKL
jgi:hypothetical protein